MLENLDLRHVMVIDIETVSQYKDYQELPEPMRALWDRKANYLRKDDETNESLYPRAAIYAEFGKIICISMGVFVASAEGPMMLRVKSFASDNEGDLLSEFVALLARQPADLILCAHNGKEFDFPYLCRRILINQLRLPIQLNVQGRKPWEINHLDTMELWKFGDYKSYTSLNLLAAVFDIPTPKDDIDGSEVYEVYWHENNLKRIVIYCQKDVVTTARLLMKFKSLSIVDDEDIVYVGIEA